MMDCNPGLGCQADDQPYNRWISVLPPSTSRLTSRGGGTEIHRLYILHELKELTINDVMAMIMRY